MEVTINLIEKALNIFTDESNGYIYEDLSLIDHTILATFNESRLFIWKKGASSKYEHFTFEHTLNIQDSVINNWSCAPIIYGLEKTLPKELIEVTKPFPLISGVPFHIFGKTEEEYIATIIERLSFAYFNIQIPTMFFEHETNVSLIKESLLIVTKEKKETQFDFSVPFHPSLGEVFPTCAILDISERFLPSYSTILSDSIKERLAEYYNAELKLNRLWDLSHLEDAPHAAFIIAPLLRSKFGKKWPQALLKSKGQQVTF
jgi:hypothetical protein